LISIALIGIGLFYCFEWMTRETLGWIADLFSLAVFASPLAELVRVVLTPSKICSNIFNIIFSFVVQMNMIHNRSTESMSFSFALCCWASALSWSIYGNVFVLYLYYPFENRAYTDLFTHSHSLSLSLPSFIHSQTHSLLF
jgi:uncharacterized protein with PQ loop repeat